MDVPVRSALHIGSEGSRRFVQLFLDFNSFKILKTGVRAGTVRQKVETFCKPRSVSGVEGRGPLWRCLSSLVATPPPSLFMQRLLILSMRL